MDINYVPFNYVSESLVKINGEEIEIEVWEHIYSKKQFQVDRKNKLYRYFNPKKKNQENFTKCPFVHKLLPDFKRKN